jgi:hypothetical protein
MSATSHANAYDAGHAAGRRDRAAGRRIAELALENWLYEFPLNNDFSDSFTAGYEAGRNK